MKKTIWVLTMLVLILSGALIYVLFNGDKEITGDDSEIVIDTSPEDSVPEEATGNYQFQDIESMEKSETIEEAFEKTFGNERLFDDEIVFYGGFYPTEAEYRQDNGDIYLLEGTFEWDGEEITIEEESLLYDMIRVNIELKEEYDSRKEMIDFLHLIQHSGLIKNPLGDPYRIQMFVYQSMDPGMNRPDPLQSWEISTEKLEVMNFSDKETMLREIHRYGDFGGGNPTIIE